LELYPKTQLNDADFYKKESDFLMGLYGVMNIMNHDMMTLYSTFIYISDEGESGGGPGEGGFGLDLFQYDQNNCPNWWGGEWSLGMYRGIAAANLLLSKVDDADMPSSVRDRIKAELTLARVIFYYYLFVGYEQCVIIDRVILPSEMYSVPKASRQEIYEFIINDLNNTIIGNLPVTVPPNEAGRYINDAALVMKAKVILFARDEARYSEALNDMRTIITSNRYDLYPDFTKLWLLEGEFCEESILEFVFTEKAHSNDWGAENNNVAATLPTWCSGRDISDPRTAEEGGLGGGWGQGTVKRNVYDWYQQGDTRREGTFVDYDIEVQKVKALGYTSDFYVATNQISFDGLGNYKYHARKGYTSPTATTYLNYNNNFRYLRFADVLLLGTELSIRANGTANAEAQGWYARIRKRAFHDDLHTPDLTAMNKQQALDAIFDERGLEFAYEMHRWVDLMRFDKGTEKLGAKGWTEKFRYMPISQMDLDESEGNLTQNPGWL
jgi:hypothetical protein